MNPEPALWRDPWTLDLALHVAAGLQWCGRRVEQGAVIYAVLEGSARFRNRVTAWGSEHGLNGCDLPFAAVEAALNLLDPKADTDRLIRLTEQVTARIAMPVKLVIIDTLSRALAGGNENAPDDMGALVSNMDRIRRETGAALVFIHHSGKDTAKGARGHSLLRAAVDTEIEVTDINGAKCATVEKQREMDKGALFDFKLNVIELGTNRHGEPVTTCVVAPLESTVTSKVSQTFLTGNNQIGARLLRLALERHGTPLPETSEYPPYVRGVMEADWRTAFYQGFPGENGDTKRKTFNRVKRDLLAKGVITSLHDLIWFSRKVDE